MKSIWTRISIVAGLALMTVPGWAQISDPPQPQVRERIVASPRLSVATRPHLSAVDDAAEDTLSDAALDLRRCRAFGAAYNFPRRDAHMVVREGTRIDFVIDDIEAVVFEKTCGWLALYYRVDVQGDDGNWRNVDTYFRHVRFCGPRVASAVDIGIPVRLPAGEYAVRARVQTYAIPLGPNLAYDRNLFKCADVASDVIYTKVRVVATPSIDDISWEAAEPVPVGDDRFEDFDAVAP